jgi:pyruvate formate lyase activating enzyme
MSDYSRRDFIKTCSSCALLFGMGGAGYLYGNQSTGLGRLTPVEAKFYTNLDQETTQCLLCPNGCIRKNNQRGKCNARENKSGKYYSLVYNSPCVIHLDKIEKLPIYHYLPGANVFSIATAGCNLTCKYCQNWQFSQRSPYETTNYSISPKEVIYKAKESGCNIIAFFYTEPVVYYEYMFDIAVLAKKAGMKNIMVTAGYINEKPMEEILPFIDAVTFGLKGFDEKYYTDFIGGRLEPVLNTLKLLERKKVWYEIVNLIVPTANDNMDTIKKMVGWIKKELSNERPLHFTRFVPEFQLKSLPFTPQQTLEKARNIALDEGLSYVYTGNMPGHEGNNTYCFSCKKLLVQRIGVRLIKNNMLGSRCPYCGKLQTGFWD